MTVTTEPLHHALLEQAHADAARILAQADERAADLAAEAEREAEAILAEARAEGAEAASLEGAQDSAAARRRAHALILAAQRQVWDELAAAARDAAHALCAGPAYEALLERLTGAARGQLGAAALIERNPAGGLRASAGGRHVDYTIDALVERCLTALGGAAAELWR